MGVTAVEVLVTVATDVEVLAMHEAVCVPKRGENYTNLPDEDKQRFREQRKVEVEFEEDERDERVF